MVKSIVCNLLRYWNVDNFLYIFKDANQQNADLFWKIVWNKKNIFDLFTAWQVVLSDKSRYLPNLTITTDNSEFLKRNQTLPLSFVAKNCLFFANAIFGFFGFITLLSMKYQVGSFSIVLIRILVGAIHKHVYLFISLLVTMRHFYWTPTTKTIPTLFCLN